LPADCTKDVTVWALIPSCNAPISYVRRCYCDI